MIGCKREALAQDMLRAALAVRRLVHLGATSNDPGPTFQELREAARNDQEMTAFLDACAKLSNATVSIHARTYRGAGKLIKRNKNND